MTQKVQPETRSSLTLICVHPDPKSTRTHDRENFRWKKIPNIINDTSIKIWGVRTYHRRLSPFHFRKKKKTLANLLQIQYTTIDNWRMFELSKGARRKISSHYIQHIFVNTHVCMCTYVVGKYSFILICLLLYKKGQTVFMGNIIIKLYTDVYIWYIHTIYCSILLTKFMCLSYHTYKIN